MKKKIIITCCLSILFLLLLSGVLIQFIDLLAMIKGMSRGAKMILHYSYDEFNIEIPSFLYYFFCTFLTTTTLTGFVGYKLVKMLKPLIIEYKSNYATLKTQKAEENKQAKIKALEEQLEELKKD